MKRASRLALLAVLILLPGLLAGCSGKKPKEINYYESRYSGQLR